ncbi:mediator of RNA polymerase II transcription subunit 13 [Oleoguttula sp. CCFEE 5521]
MDVLRQCMTNVQEVSGLPDIRVALYEREQSNAYQRSDEGTTALLARLRASGVHCTLSHGRSKSANGAETPADSMQLCLFGSCDSSLTASILSLGFALYVEGPLGDTAEAELMNGATVEEEILRAVEASITHDLWQTQRGTKVGQCTWLMSDSLQNSGSMVKLDLAWSDVDAHIVIASVTSSNDRLYQPVCAGGSASSHESYVVLAPGGTHAVLKLVDNTVAQPAQSEDWQSAVREALALEGIDIELEAEWIEVMTKESGAMMWPAALTFVESHADEFALLFNVQGSETLDGVPGEHALIYTNPLSDAEQWFNEAITRERRPVTNNDFDDDIALHAVYDPSGNGGAAFDFLSPQMIQRAETHAAGLLYPTPPDGMASLSQQTPNVTSTPVTQPAGLLHDVPQGTDPVAGGEGVGGTEHEDARPRGPSIASSVGATHGYAGHHEDLFGDLGGDEVDEEDFSFFDEPDDVRVVGSEAIPAGDADIAMSEQADDARTSPNAEVVDTKPTLEVEIVDESSPQDEVGPVSAIVVDPDDAMAIDPDHATDGDDRHAQSFTSDSLQRDAPNIDFRPLSPLTIKEQLLPPPIPASVSTSGTHDTTSSQKGSFAPLAFGVGYANVVSTRLSLARDNSQHGLLVKAARPAPTSMRGLLQQAHSTDKSSEADARSDTPESSDKSSSSASSPEMNIDLPQEAVDGRRASRKRKRSGHLESISAVPDSLEWISRLPMFDHVDSDCIQTQDLRHKAQDMILARHSERADSSWVAGRNRGDLQILWNNFNSQDLVMIAQVLAEQAVTTTTSVVDNLQVLRIDSKLLDDASATTAGNAIFGMLRNVVPTTKPSDLATLVLTRELPVRPAAPSATAAKVPGQPRPPPPRHEAAAASGPDVQSLAVPYMRVTRASDKLELLPTAMQFWDALGLGPVSGAKNVRYYCVAPKAEHVEEALESFMHTVGQAYEGCNLGVHRAARAIDEAMPGERPQWLLDVDCVAAKHGRSASLQAAWPQYRELMSNLGELLACCAHDEPATTTVIYLVDPFSAGTTDTRPALCAAFYTTYKTYIASLAQLAEKDGVSKPASDVVLQILPMDLIHKPHELVIPTSAHMASLAREVYDRLPPAANQQALQGDASSLITTAPCVHLTPTIPKRINFQLLADPPHDLLHEGSVLHVAYSFTADKHWLAVHWTDAAVLSMHGRSVAEMFEQVWARTIFALDRKQIPWKVCVTRAMPQSYVPAWEAQCWHDTVGEKTRRKQVTSVTLLAVDLEPIVQFTPPMTLDGEFGDATAGASAFLTPVSTPQASGNVTGTVVMTVSPSADSITAPPTPAPSDSTTTGPEKDAEGHLVNLEDETWSILLDRSKIPRRSTLNNITTASVLACGQLIKRGDPTSVAQTYFPAIGADLLWTIQVRALGAGIVEGNARHAEAMLREVLGTWRGLGCLAKLRGLRVGKSLDGLVPVHVVSAVEAARALEGMPR